MARTQTGIPCGVDGEVLYLSPNSAEGKAVQRIRSSLSEDEWMTVNIEHSIDIEAVRQ